MIYETNKFERNGAALVSKDASGLIKRRQEIENKKKIKKLEETVDEMKENIELILKLLQK